jgi:WD40 repeat protein
MEEHWTLLEQTLEGHSGRVSSVAFSPDGSKVVSGIRDPTYDETVRVWGAASGRRLKKLKGCSGSVSSMAFSLNVGSTPNIPYSVDETSHWITNSGLKILYIPFDLRPGVFDMNGSSLAVIGANSGRLTMLKFRPNINIDSI